MHICPVGLYISVCSVWLYIPICREWPYIPRSLKKGLDWVENRAGVTLWRSHRDPVQSGSQQPQPTSTVVRLCVQNCIMMRELTGVCVLMPVASEKRYTPGHVAVVTLCARIGVPVSCYFLNFVIVWNVWARGEQKWRGKSNANQASIEFEEVDSWSSSIACIWGGCGHATGTFTDELYRMIDGKLAEDGKDTLNV